MDVAASSPTQEHQPALPDLISESSEVYFSTRRPIPSALPMDSNKEVSIERLKAMLLENTMIKVDANLIDETTILFGEEGLGLDSLDALQIIVAIEKTYGIEIKDPATARDALQSLGVLRDWLLARLADA